MRADAALGLFRRRLPFLRADVRALNIPAGKRVLVLSDVNAQIRHLEKALELAHYRPAQDKLILLGDMMEKGPDSLEFLRYLMDFPAGKDVTYLRGNCDHLVLETAYGVWKPRWAWHYMALRPESVLWQMGREMGFVPRGEGDIRAVGRLLRRNFPRELEFLASWPVIGETDEAVFVHGGIAQDADLTAFAAHGCMKNDNFMRSAPKLRRWCVVGHTPTTLYRSAYPCADPIWDTEKKILSIDGGCAIKPDGQLNCVIFPAWGEARMEWVAYDDLETVTALEPQAPSDISRNVHWGENRVVVLGQEGDFCRCRQASSGYELDIPADFLERRGEEVYTQDATDYRLPVAAGERLKVVKKTSRGLLAKQGGTTGWYFGNYT